MESGGRAGLQQAAGGVEGGGGWMLVEARLQGGAPWGFTLQGGLEHEKPLIISKVEEGGKADSLEQPLQVGDEIIIINEVELTGYRQEAIALVKGSYKTLQLTVRREIDPGYIEEFGTRRPSLPTLPPPPFSLTPPPQQLQTPPSSQHSRPSSAVQLRIKNRRSEPASRPHSWHSTKLSEGQQEVDPAAMDTMSSAWHHSYHPSASTTDLSGGFDSGGTYLRKSPDQYSSRGSMESLDPPLSSHHHSGAQHHHPLGHHAHSGPHPTYSSCHQLSSARSSNSIDHLHSKRDSAYSSFSTSSSIPEYLASNPSFSPERSYSLETVSHRGGGSGEMQQADMRYVRTVYDAQQGLSQEHELSSTSATLLRNSDYRSEGGARLGRDLEGGVRYRGGSSSSSSSNRGGGPASNRHSVGPIWGPAAGHSSYESLKGAPAPPKRSDSYAAIKNHERPNSWSSLEHARSLRSLQKGSWHHSSGPVASGAAKGSYGAEGQLHTVIEKSPESSPTTKPRQGAVFPQPTSPTESSSGPAGPPPQSGRFILPTGMYPVPQPEPQFAQIPSAGPGPGSSGVYPALAKESSRQQQHQGLQGVRGREEGAEGRRDGRISATEIGYQNSTSSNSYHSSLTSAPTQLRTQAHEAERSHLKPAGGGSEGYTGAQKPPNHQGRHSQGIQGSHTHSSNGTHSQVFQEQIQDFHDPYTQSTPELRPSSSQEWRDSSTAVQTREDRSRSVNQISNHSEQASPRLAQGQVPTTHISTHPQAQAQAPPTSISQPSPRHLSDSAGLQYQHWDHREHDKNREHPLTRLEIALAEVQGCVSPDLVSTCSQGSGGLSDGSQGPARSLSVLEKVSRFERRERGGKHRSQSITSAHNKANLRMTEKGHSAACGAEDLRNMLERSTSGTKVHRTLSYRGGSSDHTKHRTPDPSSALQRSRSSFQLEESRESDSSKDFSLRQDIQEMLGSMPDTFNRCYRDSLKDAQSKILWSTSFKRGNLSSSTSPPPSASQLSVSSSDSHQPPSIPAKHHSLEKKGPKTKPKPQGILIMPQSPPPITSPHTPKERHVVSPQTRGPSPPALPRVPPVGPPALIRICGRKRLTADQKKRSYSEPENMNEVGVSDAETTALFRRGGETSVADRRKMFELAASRVTDGPLQNASSRPDLRQLQQDALVEYVERKRGMKREEGGQRSGTRPRSAYLLPETSNHAVSYCHSDTQSISSTSSLLSLQDSVADRSCSSGERGRSSTLPPGADLRSLQSNYFYPGRVTTPRPPAGPQPSVPSGSHPGLQTYIIQDVTLEAEFSRHSQSFSRDPDLGHQDPAAEPQLNLGLSKQLSGALWRVESVQGSRKSASAEDLLERFEEKEKTSQHSRSRSSPTAERLNQDFPPSGEIRMFGVFISETGRRSPAEDSPADTQASGGPISPQSSQKIPNTVQPAGMSKDASSSHTPVARRERQRNSERQRASSTSTLAASVGLPCPFSPSGTQDGGSAEWHASERLSQANLDAITFPGIPQTSRGDGDNPTGYNETLVADRQSRHSLSDACILEDSAKDMRRGRTFSLEMREDHPAEKTTRVSPETPTPLPLSQHATPPNSKSTTPSPPPYHPSVHQHLSSLRISESSLLSSTDQQRPSETDLSQDDFDEVFLQNPAPPSPPPPIKETSIIDDFPPPPSPIELEQEVEEATAERKSSLHSPPKSPSSSVFSLPVASIIPSLKPQPITSNTTSTTSEKSLSLEYQPLPKREKTPEELRVEMLARQLVSQDSTLVPLLDTWGSKSTVELMEEIFPNRLADNLLWQSRDSGQLDGSHQSPVMDGQKETDVDEDEKDLNTMKAELCEALRSSIAALQREKEALCEEQRCHQELGASIGALVQEQLKSNEKDKYNMFIGDLEKIVNLLLSLCSRMSRIDRSLHALEREELTEEDAAEERESLHHKRSLLLGQTEDARELKENLDRRQRVVQATLSGYLTEQQLQDYRRFVSTKPSLLIRQRHLDDLIRQRGDQLTRLAESLPQEMAEAHSWPRPSPFSSASPAPCSSHFPLLLPTSVIPGPTLGVRSTTVTSL